MTQQNDSLFSTALNDYVALVFSLKSAITETGHFG